MAPGPDFEGIVTRYYESLYQFAYSLTRAEADACDLTQQTFYVWATKGHFPNFIAVDFVDIGDAKAVVDTLTGKCRQALEATGLPRLVIAGGVGANRALRASLAELGRSVGARVYYPKPALCTDNGAMIAYAGWCRREAAQPKLPRIVARPRWPLDELTPPG